MENETMRLLKSVVVGLILMPAITCAQDSYFFEFDDESKLPVFSIQGDQLIASMKIHQVPAPKCKSISAFHAGNGPGREYKIQVNLNESPADGWSPKFKLGNDIFLDGIGVSKPMHEGFLADFSIEGDDPKKIRAWVLALQEVLKLKNDQISIDLTPMESDSKEIDPEENSKDGT
jgi:hypothetical protein